MRQSDATSATTDATLTRQSATIGEVATALGVSVRTIQRRIERGQMNVIERDGKRFVELASVAPTVATVTRQSATVDATARQSDATERDSDRREMEVELRAQLAREREFSAILKSQLEAVTQSEAQTKAALREALRAMPKQLEAGTPEPQDAAPTATANNVPNEAADAVKSATKRDGAALSYGDIADELERRLNK